MNEKLQILLLAISLVTGLLVIFLTSKLVRKYDLPHLSSYFFYLIFLFVFGIYGLIGSRLIWVFLQKQGVGSGTIESIFLIFSYIGFPFLILAWYMFIRLAREWADKGISTGFNLLFFASMAIAFTALGLVIVERERLGENNFDVIRRILLLVFSMVTGLVYGYSLLQIFLTGARQLDIKDRNSLRLFGYFYLLYAAGTVFLINMAGRGDMYRSGLILLFFGIHLLPVFFLTLHLDKNYVIAVRRPEFSTSLHGFIEKFDISKRETEVITLICKGQSNQEIGDSLFISLQTVKDHIHRIYLKTGVKNRVQLTNLIRTFS